MIRSWKARTKVVELALVTGLVAVSIFAGAPSASAAPPAGYGGPVKFCGGEYVKSYALQDKGGTGSNSIGLLDVYWSPANSGTYCAYTFDDIPGSHHMEVKLRRSGWKTAWQDSGMYSSYAGGIQHFGSNGKCVLFFGRVTVNGVNYETKFGLRSDQSFCWLP